MSTLTNQTIAERASYDVGVSPQDVGTSDVTGDWYSLESFRRVAAEAVSGPAADTTTFTVQLRQAEDSSGTNAKNLGTAVTATSGSADSILEVFQEAKASDLDSGFTHVAVQLSCSEASVSGASTIIRADGAYRP
jgi:hypothetical protein